MPLVSVIVPAYNQEQWIAETLDSVLAQTFADWECVVLNDGSTDKTLSIAEEYARKDGRFRVFSQPNAGLSAARNQGIRHAEGEYILPLDADDTISPGYLEAAMKRFSEVPETKLVYCKADFFGALTGPWKLPPYQWERFIRVNCIFCSCVYRRADFDRVGGYDETLRQGLEDWNFLLSLLQPEDIVYQIPQVFFHYRRRSESMSIISLEKEQELYFEVVKRHPELFRSRVYHDLRERAIYPDLDLERKVGHVILKPKRLIRSLFMKDQ